jgi:hypothetical protein
MSTPPITYAEVTCPNWCRIPDAVRHSVCTGTHTGPGDRERGVKVRPELWPIEGPAVSLTARRDGRVLHLNLDPGETAELRDALADALTQVGWRS